MTKLTRAKMPSQDRRLLMSVGERIRQIRLARGLTQEQLGQGEFSKSYLSAVELGKIEPSIHSLRLLAERLQVSLAYLLSPTSTEMLNQEGVLIIARARFALELNNPQKALEHLESLNLKDLANEQKREIEYLRACSLTALERYDEAIETFTEVRQMFQETDNREWFARIDFHIGEVYLSQKLYDEAYKHLYSALERVKNGEVWDNFLRIKIIHGLANYFQSLADNVSLLELFKVVENISENLTEKLANIDLFDRLASEYAAKNDYTQARNVIERGIGIVSSLNYTRNFINSFWYFGEAASSENAVDTAIKLFKTGVNMTSLYLPDPQVIHAYNRIARLYLQNSQLEEAKNTIKEARTVLQGLRQHLPEYNQVLAQLLMTEAQIAEREGKIEETEQFFQSAQTALLNEGKERGLGKIYFDYGNILIQRGQTREGYEYLRKAIELK
jgi:tetratricopeptide (TPR) repeat protein